jgi:hypothetical protein
MIHMQGESSVSFVRGEYNMTMLVRIYTVDLENDTDNHVFQHLKGEMQPNIHRKMHGLRRDHQSHI